MPLFLAEKDSQIAPAQWAEQIQAEGRRFVRVTPIFVSEPAVQPAQVYTEKGVTTIWPGTRVASDGKNVWPMTAERLAADYVERAHTDQLRDELIRFVVHLQAITPEAAAAKVDAFINRRGA